MQKQEIYGMQKHAVGEEISHPLLQLVHVRNGNCRRHILQSKSSELAGESGNSGQFFLIS